MAILVTRPGPDNAATADALRSRGFAPMLAPMLVFQPVPFRDNLETTYSGVVLTSANAVRAIVAHPILRRLQDLPVFAVGERTAQAAREAGFRTVHSADGDAAALRDVIVATAARRRNRKAPLLYPCAVDISRDLADELGREGYTVFSLPVYKMADAGDIPAEVRHAFSGDEIEAVLHYSRRSALAFVAAVRREGVEISALSLPQCCLSEAIAAALRDAGASRLIVAANPNEGAMLDGLQRALRPSQH